jgi:hypothetical protein
MIAPIPSVDVWQTKSEPRQILILHQGALFSQHQGAPFYSGNVTVGEIERYSTEEFKRCGFELVKRSLDEFPCRTRSQSDPSSELDRMSAKQKRDFFSQHSIVGIGPENGLLRLDPVRHEKVGVKGGSHKPTYLRLDVSAEEFFFALQECFTRAD